MGISRIPLSNFFFLADNGETKLLYSFDIFFSYTLYFRNNIESRGNHVLCKFVPNASSKFQDSACWLANVNAVLYHVTRAKTCKKSFIRMEIEPTSCLWVTTAHCGGPKNSVKIRYYKTIWLIIMRVIEFRRSSRNM